MNATILNLFDKVLFPSSAPGDHRNSPQGLDMTRDTNKPFDGEAQIEKTLTSNPLKLYLDVEKDFDPIRDKAQDLLWPENQDEARWSDVADRYTEQAGMPWLPPRGLDLLKSIACNRGLWEDLGNGYVTKKPQKKKTSVQVIAESEPDDDGKVRLRINAQNAGPAPRIYYASGRPRVRIQPAAHRSEPHYQRLAHELLVLDPSGQYETGDVIGLTSSCCATASLKRMASAPSNSWSLPWAKSAIHSTAANRVTVYCMPSLWTLATARCCCAFCRGVRPGGQGRVPLPRQGQKGVQIDDVKPGRLVSRTGRRLDSRTRTFEGSSRRVRGPLLSRVLSS